MRPTVHSKYTRSAVVRTGLKHLLLFVAYGSTGALLALVVGYIALTVAQKPALPNYGTAQCSTRSSRPARAIR